MGKTYFVNYFLYHILTKEENPTIVVYRHLELRWYLFSQEGTYVISGKEKGAVELEQYLYNPTTWYLVDTDQPLEVAAKTMLVSSPYSSYYKDFLNTDKATMRYMPVWTQDEIESCRKVLLPVLYSTNLTKMS